ncbi:MAG: hypothetical protein PHE61_05350 [Candidatus Omnitrophica bacterium]|nr:hypothetical protein [Candidatus Omnitrophota bacterium]
MRKWSMICLILVLTLVSFQAAAWAEEKDLAKTEGAAEQETMAPAADMPVTAVQEGAVAVENEELAGVEDESLEATGSLVSVNAEAKSLVLSDGKAETTYAVDPDAVIWLGEKEVTLADLKSGDKVSLDYIADEKGNRTTDWVEAERA